MTPVVKQKEETTGGGGGGGVQDKPNLVKGVTRKEAQVLWKF